MSVLPAPAPQRGPRFLTVVIALLKASRQRATGRMRRRYKLGFRRGGGMAAIGPTFGFLIALALGAGIHVGAAFTTTLARGAAEKVEFGAKGGDLATLFELRERLDPSTAAPTSARLVPPGGAPSPSALPDLMALICVLWWALMLACQGEGADLDTQRARHPMWEWLFSHPAPPAAIFLAEMAAPLAANPNVLTAPLYPATLYALVYGKLGFLVGFAFVGFPLAIALGCVGKALEIQALLRLPPRPRGAVLGLMGWFGDASIFVMLFAASAPGLLVGAASLLAPLGRLPWPPAGALVGLTAHAHTNMALGVALCLALSVSLGSGAVALSVAGARRGLSGQFAAQSASPTRRAPARFGRDPLYRKEWLWLRRDSGALVQALLVPLSMTALQAFNLRGLFAGPAQWNIVCGAAVLFGTYFLLTIGPKSLASEGQALWIALTWPRGLESLLRAKARFWSRIATALVLAGLGWAAWRFPADGLSVLGVAALWLVFARSLSEKTVTLATAPSSSGEPEKVPAGRRYAALLGVFAFSIGVLTRQWSLAITGVVYSTLTAAAMWENFRQHIPYLYDPWSEKAPPAPSLMHAMVGVSAMVEAFSLLSGLAVWRLGRENLATLAAALYGICAIVVALLMLRFLAGRGVALADIRLWREGGRDPGKVSRTRVAGLVMGGAALGAVLGGAAHLYVLALHAVPDLARQLDEARAQLDAMPQARISFFVLAAIFAPFAEEFLFRGLLYRALDREWGGALAVAGAAAFFASYHPFLSWPPVAALGALNAYLFKRGGRLETAIAAHMAYNAVVLLS